jgi:uncharacterized protein YbaR (Trm112 family)
MEKPFVAKRKIDEFVELVAFSTVIRFYPTAAAKYANVPVEQAFHLLINHAQAEELKLVWEIRCPYYNCHHTIDIRNDKRIVENEIMCPRCGQEFEISEEDIFPAFEINQNFKRYLREEKKTPNRLKLRLAMQ